MRGIFTRKSSLFCVWSIILYFKDLLNINRDTYACVCAHASLLYLACNDRFDKVSVNSGGYGSNARNMAAGNGVYLEHLCT